MNSYTRTLTTGFEPARAEPNRFQVYRLNHSAKAVILIYINIRAPRIELGTSCV